MAELEKAIPVRVQPSRDYKVLSFVGLANGINLAPAFDIGIIRKRIIEIKSIRIVPYYQLSEPPFIQPIDIRLTDGIDNTYEPIPQGSRINRLFDTMITGTTVTFKINNFPVIFTSQTIQSNDLPLDLWLDGIGFIYTEKVNSISFAVNSIVVQNLLTGDTEVPYVKVVIECYLT
jgi:hypothetical protein